MNTKTWHLHRLIYFIAGLFTLIGIILGFLVNYYAFYFSGIVGFMQIIFSLTGYCPMAILLNKAGIHEN